jgi:hypothetical protein
MRSGERLEVMLSAEMMRRIWRNGAGSIERPAKCASLSITAVES